MQTGVPNMFPPTTVVNNIEDSNITTPDVKNKKRKREDSNLEDLHWKERRENTVPLYAISFSNYPNFPEPVSFTYTSQFRGQKLLYSEEESAYILFKRNQFYIKYNFETAFENQSHASAKTPTQYFILDLNQGKFIPIQTFTISTCAIAIKNKKTERTIPLNQKVKLNFKQNSLVELSPIEIKPNKFPTPLHERVYFSESTNRRSVLMEEKEYFHIIATLTAIDTEKRSYNLSTRISGPIVVRSGHPKSYSKDEVSKLNIRTTKTKAGVQHFNFEVKSEQCSTANDDSVSSSSECGFNDNNNANNNACHLFEFEDKIFDHVYLESNSFVFENFKIDPIKGEDFDSQSEGNSTFANASDSTGSDQSDQSALDNLELKELEPAHDLQKRLPDNQLDYYYNNNGNNGNDNNNNRDGHHRYHNEDGDDEDDVRFISESKNRKKSVDHDYVADNMCIFQSISDEIDNHFNSFSPSSTTSSPSTLSPSSSSSSPIQPLSPPVCGSASWNSNEKGDLYTHKNIGIGTSNTTAAVTVSGDLHITGNIYKPSDLRIKSNLQKVDTEIQLNHIRAINIYDYDRRDIFTGEIEKERGVIAQEVQKNVGDHAVDQIEIVTETGDIVNDFLVVNDRALLIETIGATKEIDSKIIELSDRVNSMEKKISKPTLFYQRFIRCCYLTIFSLILLFAVVTVLMYIVFHSDKTNGCSCGNEESLNNMCVVCPIGYASDGTKCIQCTGNLVVSSDHCFCTECEAGTVPMNQHSMCGEIG